MIGIGMGFGLIFMVLVPVGLILLSIWLVKALFPSSLQYPHSPTDRSVTPREILDQRYARGEITRDEYERMKLDVSV